MKCWGLGRYPLKKNNTRIFVGSLPSEVDIGHEAQPKVQARVKYDLFLLSVTCFEGCRTPPSLDPSIHSSSCNTGSETNKNRNGFPLLHTIHNTQCYICTNMPTYIHTYTHTHTHTHNIQNANQEYFSQN